MYLSTERCSLHHVDESWLELELHVVSVGPVRMFAMLGAVNSRSVFSAIASGTDVELLLLD
jgi:hypothetical protein